MAEWVYYNPNPRGKETGDCVIRAVAAATGKPWELVYTGVALQGLAMGDMPNEAKIWRAFLRSQGFRRRLIMDDITVGEFADRHRNGTYIVGTGTHAVAVIDGVLWDIFNSQNLPAKYFYERR